MADSKVSALTELTAFTGDETFYVVEDDDGTPASRRITVENLAAALAARSEFTAAFMPVGRGQLVDMDRIVRTAGNLNLADNNNVFTEVSSALRITLAGAAVGDIVRYGIAAMWSAVAAADSALNAATIVSGAIVNQFVPGSRTPALGYGDSTAIRHAGGQCEYVLQSGDISSGSVTVSLICSVDGGNGNLYATSTYGLQVWAELWRPPT